MFAVIRQTWALLFGMFLLQLGNGMQGIVLGVRGDIEDFGNTTMGFVMAGYFLGFIFGAQITPLLLRRVGHVRVFAAFAAITSAALILYASLVHPLAWVAMRVVVGIGMAGAYVVAESWLNEGTPNEQRGQALSAYLIMQMLGIVIAQSFINVADPAGYDLFVIMAVAVSLAVVPILLSASPAPVFETTRRMGLATLYRSSPLGCVGTLLLGGVFACIFGMASVYGTQSGLTAAEISIFISTIYVGGLALQYPIGWISDRVDRRWLIALTALLGALAALVALIPGLPFPALAAAGFVIGGIANPLYSLLIAHTNDFLEREDMASASGGLILLNGVGATAMPIPIGYAMDMAGAPAFMVAIAGLMAMISAYAVFRMTVRPATPVDETMPVAQIAMGTGPVATTALQEAVYDQYEADQEAEAAEVDELLATAESGSERGGDPWDGRGIRPPASTPVSTSVPTKVEPAE